MTNVGFCLAPADRWVVPSRLLCVLGGLVGVLSIGCGGSPRAARVARAAGSGEPPARIELGQPADGMLSVGPIGPDGRGFLFAGTRLLDHGDAVEVSNDFTASPLVAALETSAGWRFVDETGAMWRAQSFLGPLSRAPSLGDARVSWLRSRGVFAATSLTRSLLLSDGGAWRASIEPVDDAAFLDASHGLAIVVGLLHHTEDGGRTWRRLPHSGVAERIVLNGERWVVPLLRTSPDSGIGVAESEAIAISAGGEIDENVPSDEMDRLERGEQIDPDLLARAALVAPRLLPRRVEIDGIVLMRGIAARDLIRLDLQRGVREVAEAFPPRRDGAGDWQLFQWGPYAGARQGVRNTVDNTPWRVLRSTDGRTFEPAFDRDTVPDGTVFGVDGRSAAWAEQLESGTRLFVTTSPPPGQTHERVVPAGARVEAVHGTLVLHSYNSPRRWLADLAAGRLDEVHYPEPLVSAKSWFDADGSIVVVGRDRRDSLALLHGAPFRPLERIPVPRGAVALGWWAGRGLAAGASLADLWRTTDAGRTWSPLAISGLSAQERARVRFVDRGYGSDVECDARGCTAEGERVRVRVIGWGDPAAPRERILAAVARPTDGSPDTGDAGDVAAQDVGWGLPSSVTCEAETARPSPLRAPPAGRASEQAGFVLGVGAGRVVRQGDRWRVMWWGADAAGAFSLATQPTFLSLPDDQYGDDPADVPQELSATPAELTREGVVLRVCRAQLCSVWVARARREITIFECPWADIAGLGPRLAALLPDGGAVVVYAVEGVPLIVDFLGPGSGALDRWHAAPSYDVGLALRGGDPVLAYPGPTWVLAPVSVLGEVARMPGSSEALRACAAPPEAGALVAAFANPEDLDEDAPEDGGDAGSDEPLRRPWTRARIEIGARFPCIRSLSIARGGEVVAVQDGGFRGWVLAQHGARRAVDCVLDDD